MTLLRALVWLIPVVHSRGIDHLLGYESRLAPARVCIGQPWRRSGARGVGAFRLSLDPDALIEDLPGVGAQQQVEIVKALCVRRSVSIKPC